MQQHKAPYHNLDLVLTQRQDFYLLHLLDLIWLQYAATGVWARNEPQFVLIHKNVQMILLCPQIGQKQHCVHKGQFA